MYGSGRIKKPKLLTIMCSANSKLDIHYLFAEIIQKVANRDTLNGKMVQRKVGDEEAIKNLKSFVTGAGK